MFKKIFLTILWGSLFAFGQTPLQFSVMGDVPRSVHEDTLLQQQIVIHNRHSASEFMLHLGDIKSGSAPCDEAVYAKVAGYLRRLDVPVFIVPGDNEWNDCDDPDAAWRLWAKYFLDFKKYWYYEPVVDHQPQRPENIAWTSKGVLLVGINLVGGRVFDQLRWDILLRDDAAWVSSQLAENRDKVRAATVFCQAHPRHKHASFINEFQTIAERFAKPILFIHGDGHHWQHEEGWLAPNILRVQVDQGGIAPPLQVTVTPDGKFIFDRAPFKKAAGF